MILNKKRPKPIKNALITGASSGIGKATVHRFARAGWNVVATTRRDDTRFPEHANVVVIQLEQTDAASIKAAMAAAVQAFGDIDLLVNNAGYCLMGPFETNSMEQIRVQYETNVFGLIAVTQAALPHLKASGGGVINIASISADNGYPFGSVYSSSKAAVMVLTEALNIELSAVNVFAKAVLPGFTATDTFLKLDLSPVMQSAYSGLWRQFTSMQGEVKGYSPARVAEMVFKAATDGRMDQVRYYPTPDAALVPTSKRILGHAGYWRMFRGALLKGPSRLQRLLAPQGDQAVKIVLPQMREI